ncbi:MAG: KH domain-containing protein [Candidatus Parcubacteria bacterium]|nr:KH domain-containing protein [Candidatus Parcubacteria bacterium]
MEKDQKFLETLLDMLVSNPKKVKVKRTVNERGVLLTIDVDPEDLGTLIGKQGRNIDSIRQLVRIIGMKEKAFVSIKLNQPEKKEE